MGQKKQAKVLTDRQQKIILAYFEKTRYPERNRAVFMLSSKAGLRAGEISGLCWMHVFNEESNAIADIITITDDIAKGAAGGRKFHMGKEVIDSLQALYESYDEPPHWYDRVIVNQCGDVFSPNGISRLFYYWYTEVLNWPGYSSHSGRRTFITNCARKASLYGASIRDVQLMAGHKYMSTTQIYIQPNEEAQKLLVNNV